MVATHKLDEIKSDLINECKKIKEMDLENKSKKELINILKYTKQNMTNMIIEIDEELSEYWLWS